MKQSLQLKLHQQLALTPQLQQSIRLLQLSTLELSQEISQILQENPMLERADQEEGGDGAYEPPAESSAAEQQDSSGPEDVYEELAWGDRPVAPATDDEDEERGFQATDRAASSLHQHLADQLALMALTDRDRQFAALLVEAIDDDGYLTPSLEELAALLPTEPEVDPAELSIALRLVQSLDPVGVGARDLAECLLLQLDAMPADTPHLQAARRLVRQYLPLLAEREYGKLKKLLGIDKDRDFIAVRQLITSLDPRPGARYAQVDTQYVVPDVVVRKLKGKWLANLNPAAMPRLGINEMYASILRQNREGGSALSSQLQEARWLIKNVQQRFQTILRVAQTIVDRQRLFFEHGDIAMRPLILREVAEELGLHESTISRVTNQKYMMTPRGLYEFKYFFGSALATEAGGAASSTAIRALIRQCVDAESHVKPLSDQAIAEMLGGQGYVVARRTVAKYREQMNIPPANQRKSL